MSSLATIVGGLGELSESELRQLYLMIGVRLGNPDVPPGAKPQKKDGGKASGTRPNTTKGGKKDKSGKGNPNRKSQWANHPLYQEYSRLKKVVEAQAKEAKRSFNDVDTVESRAYKEAFTQWVDAKHSFRGHGESGQIRSKTDEANANEEEESSEEEEEEGAKTQAPAGASPSTSSSRQQAKPAATPTPNPPVSVAGKSSSSGDSGKTAASPAGKGKARSK